jgi:hypothetical protein
MDLHGLGAAPVRSVQHHEPGRLRPRHLELHHCRMALFERVVDLWDCVVGRGAGRADLCEQFEHSVDGYPEGVVLVVVAVGVCRRNRSCAGVGW